MSKMLIRYTPLVEVNQAVKAWSYQTRNEGWGKGALYSVYRLRFETGITLPFSKSIFFTPQKYLDRASAPILNTLMFGLVQFSRLSLALKKGASCNKQNANRYTPLVEVKQAVKAWSYQTSNEAWGKGALYSV